MTRLGKLVFVFVAAAGFAAAHLFVQAGNAMEVPVPTVTAPSLPVPTLTAPTLTAPTLPVPTTTTPTLPVPSLPAPTVSVPTVPVPPPPVTTAPLPVRLPPVTTSPLPTLPAPRPAQPTTTTTPAAGSPAPAGGTATPSSGYGSSGPSAGQTSSASTATGSARSTTRTRTFAARTHRTANRVSVRLAFVLPNRGRIFLVVRGPAPSCRVAGVIPVRGRKGENTVYFAGRVHGRRLAPGVYLISLSPNRHHTPGAATEYVRVVSARRSLPLPDGAKKPTCPNVTSVAMAATSPGLIGRATPKQATAQPSAQVAGVAVPAPSGDENDDGASGLPGSGLLGAATGSADEHPFLAAAVLTLVGGLLIAMLALVTRFMRGSWNP